MNPGLVVKLRPVGPWRIGPDSGARNRVDFIYHSDSLYSAVASAMVQFGSLDEWLSATARAASPAVCFSSCFPFQDETVFVVPPRTIWPPATPALLAARVRWKSARFVPLGMVQAMLAGRALKEHQWSVDGASQCLVPAGHAGPFRTDMRWNAAVDRLTGASERHSTACLEFRAGAGLWTVVSFADDAARDRWLDPVKAAFRLLADTGLGGERSRGWGRSEAPEFIEGRLPDMILPPVSASAEPEAAAVAEPEAEPAAAVEPAKAEPAEAMPPVEAGTLAAAESAAAPKPAAEAELAPEAEPAEAMPLAEAGTLAAAEPEAEPVAAVEPAAEPAEAMPPAEAGTLAAAGSAAAPKPAAEAEPATKAEPAKAKPPAEAGTLAEAEPAPEAEPAEAMPLAEAGTLAAAEAEPAEAKPPAEAGTLAAMPAAQAEPPASAGTAVGMPAEASAPPDVAAQPKAAAPADEPAPPESTEIAAGEAAVKAPSDIAPLVADVEPEAAAAVDTQPEATRPEAAVLSEAAPAPPGPESAAAPEGAHLHWLLSLFSPAPGDTVDWARGNYAVLTRGGRIESPSGSGELKKQVQMVTEGSVLSGGSAPTGAAPDVAPDGFAHPVFRAGFAVSIPLPRVRS
jgi:CRISPR type III-A-associated RAMP protein Csm4